MTEKFLSVPGGSLGSRPAFVAQMREILGGETEAFFGALSESPALALRINPFRQGAEKAAEAYTQDVVPWEKYGRYLLPGAKPGASIWHFAGAFYVQEASAMLPAAVLNAQPYERILDLCAAPGGKSSQIASYMGGKGVLIANEPEPSRAKILAGNLERLGIRNAAVVCEYPQKLAEKWVGYFDAIMVDAPCSGEGMFRREPAAIEQWAENSPAGCAQRQAGILDAAAVLLRDGGRMVYSTCTYNRAEDEDTVAAFLKRHPEFHAANFSVGGLDDSDNGMMKIWPHKARGDGQFAALLIKDGNATGQTGFAARVAKPAAEALNRFESEFASVGGLHRPALQGDTLWAIPEGAPDFDGIRVVAPGIMLAKVLKGRLEPAHQAAMTLETARSIELDKRCAEAYLMGETVPTDEVGWLVAKYRGMPLGWGKASGGQLKNHLPKGLRRRSAWTAD